MMVVDDVDENHYNQANTRGGHGMMMVDDMDENHYNQANKREDTG